MLEVKDLTYSYDGKKAVLKGIHASFSKGNLYCIEGKSGSGKTTLLSLIAGLDRVKVGDINIEGESLKTANLDDYRARKIGVVFQGYNLMIQLSGLDNVLLSMAISKTKHDNRTKFALDLLAQVGIDEEKARRRVVELSGGEQQRVAIARALSHSPAYIFADEPTGNLDSETEQTIMEIFKNLTAAGKCIIIVTHSNRVVQYADHIYRMRNGVLREQPVPHHA